LNLMELVRDVPDYPSPGIVFKDLTPLFADPAGLKQVVDTIAVGRQGSVDAVIGIEARGFLLAAPVAYVLGAGVVPIRKPGKLPRPVHERAYELEYGSSTLQVHRDGLEPGARVLVIDDVLATGGTAAAAVHLVEQCSATVAGVAVLLELTFLNGRTALPGLDVQAVLSV
jgi:adenine phosphoribosyltransferase